MLKQEKLLFNISDHNDANISELTIQNFSCIKNLKINFKKLTVFIGEQASGKSITCKLYYFFTQAFRTIFSECLADFSNFDMFKKRLEREFHKIFPDTAWNKDSFVIQWYCNNKRVIISHRRSNKHITLGCDDYFDVYDDALKTANAFFAKKRNNRISAEDDVESRWQVNRFVSRYVVRSLLLPVVDYIPAGRSFFSTIQDNVFALLSDNIGIDYFLKEFGRKFEIRKSRYFRQEVESGLSEYAKILHGAYQFDGKEQWIIRDKDHKVRLADSSSGQQEVFPLLLILHNLRLMEHPYARRVVIEEPEAHLFPTAQMAIVELLQRLMQRIPSLGFVITTHSPFILCCINNLISKSKTIRGSVSAYHLYDGISDPLYDDKLQLINAERFDNISTDIANGGFVL